MTPKDNTNPWKGLYSYKEGEHLYGRDDEIYELSQCVAYNTQTVVYGKFGVGKSSIVNAGIFPIARATGMHPVMIRLNHDKDAESYLEQVKKSLVDSGLKFHKIGTESPDKKEQSLWELFHTNYFSAQPLVAFDQFEEIFTLQHDESKRRHFFSQLADLLNEVIPQYFLDFENTRNNEAIKSTSADFKLNFSSPDEGCLYLKESLFNLVFIIREDYLAFLERYTTLIPVMKSNRYYLGQINKKQAKEIIIRPRPGLVSDEVAELIIQKVTSKIGDGNIGSVSSKDEVDAAILSIYLSRLYEKSNGTITKDKVEEFSGRVIEDFYEESISGLDVSEIEHLESQLLSSNGRRKNVPKADLVKSHKPVSEYTIDRLIERKLLRSFDYNDDEYVEFTHDKLCEVVSKRIIQREQANKLKKKEKKLKRFVAMVLIFTIAALGFAAYKYINKPTYQYVVPAEKFDLQIVLIPDSTLEGAPWKAWVNLEADSLQMTISEGDSIHKLESRDTLRISGPKPDTLFLSMPMDNLGKKIYFSVLSNPKEDLCKAVSGKISLSLPDTTKHLIKHEILLTRSRDAMFRVEGVVKTISNQYIQDAYVVFNNSLRRTDESGKFTFFLNDPSELDANDLYIFKSEYKDTMIYLKNLQGSKTYILRLKDEYKHRFTNELSLCNKAFPNGRKMQRDSLLANLTKQDSLCLSRYFGDNYDKLILTKMYVSDTINYEVLDKSNAGQINNTYKSDSVFYFMLLPNRGRILGKFVPKNPQKMRIFNGTMAMVEKDKIWRVDIQLYDSIFNRKRMTGILRGDNLYLDK